MPAEIAAATSSSGPAASATNSSVIRGSGPDTEMARAAPGRCGTCGFFLPVAGALRGAFGVCGNAYSPADGAVVAVAFGCGAHSDVVFEPVSPVTVAELVYDDGVELERTSAGR